MMQKPKYKGRRPTMLTAHQYHREGSWYTGPEHFMTPEERQAEREAIIEDLACLVQRQFPRTGNIEYAILKGHLIVEHALVQFLRVYSAVHTEPQDIRLSFAQKLEVAVLLGFGMRDPVLLPTVEALNRVRNQVAHSFGLDKAVLDEMLRVNHEDYRNWVAKNDRERIRGLKLICAYICGRVAAEVDLQALFTREPKVAP